MAFEKSCPDKSPHVQLMLDVGLKAGRALMQSLVSPEVISSKMALRTLGMSASILGYDGTRRIINIWTWWRRRIMFRINRGGRSVVTTVAISWRKTVNASSTMLDTEASLTEPIPLHTGMSVISDNKPREHSFFQVSSTQLIIIITAINISCFTF